MRKDLAWYLKQELLLEGSDEKDKKKKEESSGSAADGEVTDADKETKNGVHPTYGEEINARGNYGAAWRNLLGVWREDPTKTVSWKQPAKLFNNLGISKKQDWVQTLEQLNNADQVGDVFTSSRFLDENTIQFKLAGNWRKVGETAHGSKLFILFWICEVIRAWNPQLAHGRGGRIAPFSIKGLRFYMSGSEQLTVHWENRGY